MGKFQALVTLCVLAIVIVEGKEFGAGKALSELSSNLDNIEQPLLRNARDAKERKRSKKGKNKKTRTARNRKMKTKKKNKNSKKGNKKTRRKRIRIQRKETR